MAQIQGIMLKSLKLPKLKTFSTISINYASFFVVYQNSRYEIHIRQN